MTKTPKTCFVIIGYGPKTDYSTGRIIDLDKSFEYIIKPAFEELGFLCYRACDINHSGVIDTHMYDNILKADFVVADLSTLNQNVLYELGVRHAVRKNTTIIIAESELLYPFDLSHIVIESYEHFGKGIDHGEVIRFKKLLQEKARELLANPKVDSPLYTLFPDLEIPRFSAKEVEAIKENIKEDGSLSDLMSAAEAAKNNKDYCTAISLLEQALALNQDNILVSQRLALMIYKSEVPGKLKSLYKALEVLQPLNPRMSTDIETLGLSGAIYKRLFDLEEKLEDLELAIWYYEKGFYIANDYYNGINLAFVLMVGACQETVALNALFYYGSSKRVRRKVKEICIAHLSDRSWTSREDKVWIFLTLAEIAFAVDDLDEEKIYIDKAKKLDDNRFALESYMEQREKFSVLKDRFEKKYQEALRLLEKFE
ncbi:TRAFs-binding domain-containing protein [Chitinophaga sp. 30R24]|uniref:TRAFs-binding domain-containing protein n=1 Tax=Chitinophaga sp. 30R24 TaxID=3248838 RepID=UPI003B9052F6